MKPEIKTFELKLDDAESSGKIRGFASTFGNVDLGNDVVVKGAFAKTIKENSGKIPILDGHDPNKQIGWNLRAEETEDGLYVEGLLDLNTQGGAEKYSLAQKAVEIGAKMGLSIGYQTIKAAHDKTRKGVRLLKEVRLLEYSVVTFPMNTEAMILAAKSAKREEQFQMIKDIASQAGLDPTEVYRALCSKSDTELDEAAEESKYDPSAVGQSLDELLKILKGE